VRRVSPGRTFSIRRAPPGCARIRPELRDALR
jgi:hypothetical protein